MLLTDKEQDVIFSAQLQADLPVSALRELSGHRDHTIRYCLQRNLERNVIERRCFVNLCLLGYTHYEIFFSLSPEGERNRQGLLQALVSAPQISWVGELGGDYQYGFNFCARGANEITEFQNSLSQRFGQIFSEKAVAVRVSLSYFGNKYLSTKERALSVLHYEATPERVEIDEIDQRILAGLVAHSGESRRSLAQKLGMPLSTLEFRIKKLEQARVIVGYYLLLDPSRIGMHSFLLLIGVKSISPELQKKFDIFCEKHPNVTVLIHCVGSWDFEIAVEVRDPRHITQITQSLNDELGSSLRFVKVLPSFSYPKVREYPFESPPKIANA